MGITDVPHESGRHPFDAARLLETCDPHATDTAKTLLVLGSVHALHAFDPGVAETVRQMSREEVQGAVADYRILQTMGDGLGHVIEGTKQPEARTRLSAELIKADPRDSRRLGAFAASAALEGGLRRERDFGRRRLGGAVRAAAHALWTNGATQYPEGVERLCALGLAENILWMSPDSFYKGEIVDAMMGLLVERVGSTPPGETETSLHRFLQSESPLTAADWIINYFNPPGTQPEATPDEATFTPAIVEAVGVAEAEPGRSVQHQFEDGVWAVLALAALTARRGAAEDDFAPAEIPKAGHPEEP